MSMRVKAWSNGSDGYGINVGRANRDRYFSRSWSNIRVDIDGRLHDFRLTESFWRSCTEFRGSQIGTWLRAKGFAPWPKGKPPEFELVPLGGNRFRLLQLVATAIADGAQDKGDVTLFEAPAHCVAFGTDGRALLHAIAQALSRVSA